jgi:uncharacterized protein YhhL (DUF1145 family)
MSVYRNIVQLTALLTVAIGVALVVVTLVHGVGIGLLIGALFIAAGAGRLYMLRRKS